MLAEVFGFSHPDGESSVLPMIVFASNSIRDYKDDPTEDYRFIHLIKYLPGRPAVACSNAGMWPVVFDFDPLTGKSDKAPILSPVAWAITIIPTSTERFTGHIAVEHYCVLIPDSEYAKFTVEFVNGKIKKLESLEGEEAEQLISAELIVQTEMLCISSERWDSFSSEKKSLIRQVWETEDKIEYRRIGRMQPFEQEYDLAQLNLFR